jgi:IMS family HHH motif
MNFSSIVHEVLGPLPVGRLWGVGKKGEKRLHALGLHTIGQLAGLPEQVLIDHFGGAQMEMAPTPQRSREDGSGMVLTLTSSSQRKPTSLRNWNSIGVDVCVARRDRGSK